MVYNGEGVSVMQLCALEEVNWPQCASWLIDGHGVVGESIIRELYHSKGGGETGTRDIVALESTGLAWRVGEEETMGVKDLSQTAKDGGDYISHPNR